MARRKQQRVKRMHRRTLQVARPKISKKAWERRRTTTSQAEAMLSENTNRAVMQVAKKYSWTASEVAAARKYVTALVFSYGDNLVAATKRAASVLREMQLKAVRQRFATTCAVLQTQLEDEVILQVAGMNEPWYRTMREDAQRFIGRSRHAA